MSCFGDIWIAVLEIFGFKFGRSNSYSSAFNYSKGSIYKDCSFSSLSKNHSLLVYVMCYG